MEISTTRWSNKLSDDLGFDNFWANKSRALENNRWCCVAATLHGDNNNEYWHFNQFVTQEEIYPSHEHMQHISRRELESKSKLISPLGVKIYFFAEAFSIHPKHFVLQLAIRLANIHPVGWQKTADIH